MKRYTGYRPYGASPSGGLVAGRVAVKVEGDGQPRDLPPRHDLRNHSPDGFEWGYEGSGPAQLALAILADLAGAEIAERYYQHFKRRVVARFAKDGWQLTASQAINELLSVMEAEHHQGGAVEWPQ